MKRIVVTGASGFIGSRLLARLRSEAIHVCATTRRYSAMPYPAAGADIEWWQNDLDEPGFDLDALVRDCDAVVHLAGQAHDPSAGPEKYERLNHILTRRLAAAAAAAGVQHFIFRSSLKVN